MKFGYAILYVDDVEATIAFYEKAFGQTREMVAGGEYGELKTGSTKLAFAVRKVAPINVQPAGPSSDPSAAEVAFTTDNVQAAFDKAVAAGAKPVSSPAKKPWGQIVSYVRDNNGFLVEICSPMG
jgi:uncharacterized glyoxalase superfamily protein PhnB